MTQKKVEMTGGEVLSMAREAAKAGIEQFRKSGFEPDQQLIDEQTYLFLKAIQERVAIIDPPEGGPKKE